ncbi:MAG: hypothetical protein V1804_00085 [Patescibacteria group bacterium]
MMYYWYKLSNIFKFSEEKKIHKEVLEKISKHPEVVSAPNGMMVISQNAIEEIMGDLTREFMEKVLPEHPNPGFSAAVSVF